PRIATAEALDDVMVRDRLIQSLPEIEQAVGKVGRAETSTDPSGIEMVETIINLKPQEWWPKRKWDFDDALEQAAIVAAQMQQKGWLKADQENISPQDWARVASAVQDPEYLKRNPRLTRPSELLNTAASVAVDKFDADMRAFARRRQVE